jgi:hypothetical protein
MLLSSLINDVFFFFYSFEKNIFIDMINIYNFAKTKYTLYLKVNESL